MSTRKNNRLARRHSMMLHEHYPDFDLEFSSRVYLARKALLGSVESFSLLPDSGLKARELLSDNQLQKVDRIRKRRLAATYNQFTPD